MIGITTVHATTLRFNNVNFPFPPPWRNSKPTHASIQTKHKNSSPINANRLHNTRGDGEHAPLHVSHWPPESRSLLFQDLDVVSPPPRPELHTTAHTQIHKHETRPRGSRGAPSPCSSAPRTRPLHSSSAAPSPLFPARPRQEAALLRASKCEPLLQPSHGRTHASITPPPAPSRLPPFQDQDASSKFQAAERAAALLKPSSAPPWLLSLPSLAVVRRRRRRAVNRLLGRGHGERREYLILLGRRRQLLLQMLVLHQLLLLLRRGHGKLNRIGHDEERAQNFCSM